MMERLAGASVANTGTRQLAEAIRLAPRPPSAD
jgi:hypothetical protein